MLASDSAPLMILLPLTSLCLDHELTLRIAWELGRCHGRCRSTNGVLTSSNTSDGRGTVLFTIKWCGESLLLRRKWSCVGRFTSPAGVPVLRRTKAPQRETAELAPGARRRQLRHSIADLTDDKTTSSASCTTNDKTTSRSARFSTRDSLNRKERSRNECTEAVRDAHRERAPARSRPEADEGSETLP